jgi:hypothetical protein
VTSNLLTLFWRSIKDYIEQLIQVSYKVCLIAIKKNLHGATLEPSLQSNRKNSLKICGFQITFILNEFMKQYGTSTKAGQDLDLISKS